jgi:hypothetical protein
MKRLNVEKYKSIQIAFIVWYIEIEIRFFLLEKLAEPHITLEDSAEDCFDDTMIDVYRKRPRSREDITLYQFLSWFEKKVIVLLARIVLLWSNIPTPCLNLWELL